MPLSPSIKLSVAPPRVICSLKFEQRLVNEANVRAILESNATSGDVLCHDGHVRPFVRDDGSLQVQGDVGIPVIVANFTMTANTAPRAAPQAPASSRVKLASRLPPPPKAVPMTLREDQALVDEQGLKTLLRLRCVRGVALCRDGQRRRFVRTDKHIEVMGDAGIMVLVAEARCARF